MIDLAKAGAKADAAERAGRDHVRVSPSWLRQAIAEIEQGRAAAARAGRAFGLPEGKTL